MLRHTVNATDLRARRLQARDALVRAGHPQFKPVSSAKWVNVEMLRKGRIKVSIEHDTIKGVTPHMMRWWFENLGSTTTWNGVDFTGPEVSHYHLWHHRDHIAVTPLSGAGNKGFAVGELSRIDEQFNDFNDRIHAKVRTTRLDDEEFCFNIMFGNIRAGEIVHRYGPEDGGLRFYAETTIGAEGAAIPANLIRPLMYSRRSAVNWIRHNIEETGRSEDVIPILYENAQQLR